MTIKPEMYLHDTNETEIGGFFFQVIHKQQTGRPSVYM